jgi:HK97 family phage major capsid protein
MDFTAFGAAEYRALDDADFEARRQTIIDLLNADELPEGVTTDQLMEERDLILSEVERRNAAAELRGATVKNVLSASKLIASNKPAEDKAERADADPFDTPEYRNAFMELVCRNKAMPEQFTQGIYVERTDAHTETTDVPVMIPTTLSTKIIEELEAENGIFAAVTKTNVPGGVEYPVMTLKPVSTWVGEDEVSDFQKLEADVKISFSYYELECRVSQTMLASIVTFAEFQRRIVPAIVRSMSKKIEAGVVSGTGTGQMLGIVNDPRVTNKVALTATQVKDWKAWRKVVKKAIPRAYRGGTFIMAQSTWDAYIETMADDNNAPVSIGYNPVTGAEQLRFMGFPVLLVDDTILADFDDAASDDVFAIYGKLSDYAINWNQQLQTVQYTDWDERKRKMVAYAVLDGKVLDANGFVLVAKA